MKAIFIMLLACIALAGCENDLPANDVVLQEQNVNENKVVLPELVWGANDIFQDVNWNDGTFLDVSDIFPVFETTMISVESIEDLQRMFGTNDKCLIIQIGIVTKEFTAKEFAEKLGFEIQ